MILKIKPEEATLEGVANALARQYHEYLNSIAVLNTDNVKEYSCVASNGGRAVFLNQDLNNLSRKHYDLGHSSFRVKVSEDARYFPTFEEVGPEYGTKIATLEVSDVLEHIEVVVED